MFFPCEVVLKKFSPAVKVQAAKLLSQKYSLTQEEIAATLGITQAAVSKYLAGKYSKGIGEVVVLPSVKKTAGKVAESIALRKPAVIYAPESVCACCREMRSRGLVKFAEASGGLRLSEKCDVR